MSTKYLLPCECGSSVPVERIQAGQMVSCNCGRQLEVPTLLKLQSLEAIETESPPRTSETSWGIGHGLVLVGALVTLAAAGGSAYFFVTRPLPPEAIHTRADIEGNISTMPLVKTYRVWEYVRHGLYKKRAVNVEYKKEMKAYHIRIGVPLVITVLAGVATLAGGVAMAYAKRKPRGDPNGSAS